MSPSKRRGMIRKVNNRLRLTHQGKLLQIGRLSSPSRKITQKEDHFTNRFERGKESAKSKQ